MNVEIDLTWLKTKHVFVGLTILICFVFGSIGLAVGVLFLWMKLDQIENKQNTIQKLQEMLDAYAALQKKYILTFEKINKSIEHNNDLIFKAGR